MNTYKELLNFINEFNKNNDVEFEIDSIRIEFSKQHKLNELKQLGNWKRLLKNSNILYKLKNRLAVDEVTSAYQLEKQNIYFYNKKDETKKYRKAEMVIFGMKQYHKEPPPHSLVEKIVNMLTFKTSKVNSNIDVCFDMKIKPKINNLKAFFELKQYRSKSGKLTDTFYINSTYDNMIEKITIYNKALKNNLDGTLWRIEAKVLTPNIKCLQLPLSEFKNVISIAKG